MVHTIWQLIHDKETPFAVNCATEDEAKALLTALGKLGFEYQNEQGESISLLNNKGTLSGDYVPHISPEAMCYDFYNSFPYFTCDSALGRSLSGREVLQLADVLSDEALKKGSEEAVTYVEIFDSCSIENIISALAFKPRKVIMVGTDNTAMNRARRTYQQVLGKRGSDLVEFSCRSCRESLPEMIALLSDIVEQEENCWFDVTGGTDMFLLALGYVWHRYPQHNIQIHRFDIEKHCIIDCDDDGILPFKEFPSLTVKQNLKIYGGKIVSDDAFHIKKHSDLPQEDLQALWDVMTDKRVQNKTWNTTVSKIASFISPKSDDGFCSVYAEGDSITYEKNYLTKENCDLLSCRMMRLLEENGLVSVGKDYYGKFSGALTFKNVFVEQCLSVMGQLLEYKIFDVACKAKKADGVTPLFSDVRTGVHIDWLSAYKTSETTSTNEVDLVMMDGVIPIFVSCKNGVWDVNELYKLNTVAENFGSKYAKKLLITSSLPTVAEDAVRQRCKDLGIQLVTNAQQLDDFDIEIRLRNYSLF